MLKNRCYSELLQIKNFDERFKYLKLSGIIGNETFGYNRMLNQRFYTSYEWKKIRDFIIIRDNGCDLGVEDYDIQSKILIHHIIPIKEEDLFDRSELLLSPENLITTSYITHNAIHYGNEAQIIQSPIVRIKNDTCPWKN